jgi:hypothetical protein
MDKGYYYSKGKGVEAMKAGDHQYHEGWLKLGFHENSRKFRALPQEVLHRFRSARSPEHSIE